MRLEAKNFVIATGSVVAPPIVPGLVEAGYLDSDAVLDSSRVPESIVVLGGGYVGAELGQFLARMGVRTTFLIRAKHLLSTEDRDVGDAVTLYFRQEGIDVRAGVLLSHVEIRDAKKVVHYTLDGEPGSVEADEIFYALGRVPNVGGLEIERAGVACHAVSGIEVGPDMRTTARNIFAVGDVTGYYPLVHVAIYQGELAARNAVLGAAEEADYALQRTHTVFTDPQIAVVGRSENRTASGARAVSLRVVSLQRPRQSRRDQQDEGLREDARVAGRREDSRCGRRPGPKRRISFTRSSSRCSTAAPLRSSPRSRTCTRRSPRSGRTRPRISPSRSQRDAPAPVAV